MKCELCGAMATMQLVCGDKRQDLCAECLDKISAFPLPAPTFAPTADRIRAAYRASLHKRFKQNASVYYPAVADEPQYEETSASRVLKALFPEVLEKETPQ